MTGISVEMRQASLSETIRDTLPLKRLLSHTCDHLRKINIGAFTAAQKHLQRRVTGLQFLAANITHFISNLAQCTIDITFQRLFSIAARFILQCSCVILFNHGLTFVVSFVKNVRQLHFAILFLLEFQRRSHIGSADGHAVV